MDTRVSRLRGTSGDLWMTVIHGESRPPLVQLDSNRAVGQGTRTQMEQSDHLTVCRLAQNNRAVTTRS